MYGLPKQKPKTWQETLKVIIELNPDRLAVFGYAHVPWMRPHQKEIDESDLPDTDQRLELFKLAYGRLLDAGYVHIGMDHFARENDELALALEQGRLSRNFQGYTVRHASELIGLGATAISDIGHTFAQNQVQLAPYKEAIARKGMATFRGLVTSEEDRLRRYVITELMCNLTLDIKRTERQFGISFSSHFASELERLIPLVDDGLVARENDCISVTPKGRLFVRHVGLAFDSYSTKPRKDGPRFSKTV
jgi:oxygen-independent coproporphyrinogen-3 oxidase